ncbi:DUF6541 family protein [Microbacterium sp.]|uniref:DUF6541 family protein n=1 Tax=Microbacterium sp. TaxID=51671 RepID=UPI003A9014BB
MAWFAQWGAFLATALVVFVPGLVAAWAIGLRRLAAWAFAPVGSVAMISAVATVFGFARIPWNLPTAVIGIAAIALILVVCRLALRVRRNDLVVADPRWPVAAGLIVGAVLITVRVTTYIGDPSHISQTSDAVFHLGAVRAIIEHQAASSFGLAGLLDPAAIGGFYPGAWHEADSLITLIMGLFGGTLVTDIAVATNALALTIAAVVWPLGIAWLTQVATGRRWAAAAAGVMSAGLVIFPLELLQYGVLYPYFLAVAMVPASIAAVIALSRQTWSPVSALVGDQTRAGRITAVILAFGMGSVAIGNAQPSALLAFWLAVWLCAVGGTVLLWRMRHASRWWASAGVLVAVPLLVVAWVSMGGARSAVWDPKASGSHAALTIVSGGFVESPPAWWVSVLMFVGLIAVLRRTGARWLALGWFAFAFLAFVAYAVHNEFVRSLSVGPWYSDPYRLAALVPVMMIPLAAAGVTWIIDLCVALVSRRADPGSNAMGVGVGVAAVTVLALIGIAVVAAEPLVLRYQVNSHTPQTQSSYAVDDASWLHPDERALLERLGTVVPKGAVVLDNPGTGGAWGYYLSGVDVYPAKWQPPTDADYVLLKKELHKVATDQAVCDAVRALKADYVLDFGPGGAEEPGLPGPAKKMPGFTGFEGVRGFQLIDHQGDAQLWRITECAGEPVG